MRTIAASTLNIVLISDFDSKQGESVERTFPNVVSASIEMISIVL